MDKKEQIPPAWDYNPSSWGQRMPLIVIAIIGFFIALYMGLFQLEVLDSVWDPFFGDGSRKILTSSVSEALPVPDAILGAFGYLVDAVTGVIGGVHRWKKMPWIVVVFGVAIGPLGMISILLVILQPVLIGAWCTLCLVTAVLSVVMISPAVDEMLASLQYLQRVKRSGHSVWKAFWGKDNIHLLVK
ncbi:MAG TPA: vitamin K epoxide reductase family protein [Flavisolibacter sp.]|nr:vitamin K epoxide reductase family protein [Flavisolibacter sp.]